MRTFGYSSLRDRRGLAAWFDNQSRRWISVPTLQKRTGLSRLHIKDYENGRDGYGYKTSFSVRKEEEDKLGVSLV
jgi:hypothetical protein